MDWGLIVMQLWVTEKQTDSLCISFKVKEILHQEQTEFQHLAIVDTEQYGRMLLLDGVVQTTIDDEFVYHEMMAHVPMLTHPEPKKVAVIGGGDGGSIRELLKHPSVEEATLVEIDGRVIEASKEFLPEIAAGLSDPRVKIIVGDGIAHIAEMENYYDVILIDSTDPVGAAFGLFTEEFYANVYKALTAEGIMVAQTESPFVNQDIIERSFRGISQNFPVTELYLGCVPTYPGGLWSFTLGSKKHHPLEANWERADQLKTKYYTKEVHRCLPIAALCAGAAGPYSTEIVDIGSGGWWFKLEVEELESIKGYLDRPMTYMLSSDNYQGSEVVIFGIPMDFTTSYRPGARFGPQRVREVADALETYSPYLDRDLAEVTFYDAGDVEVHYGNVAASLDKARQVANRLFAAGKKASNARWRTSSIFAGNRGGTGAIS